MPRPLRSWWRGQRHTAYAITLLLCAACGVSLWHNRSSAPEASTNLGPSRDASPTPAGAASEQIAPAQVGATLPGEAAESPAEGAAAGPGPAATAAAVFPPYAGNPEDDDPSGVELEGAHHLDYYYGQLTLSELGVQGAVTRGSLWGDSVIGGDGLTQELRQRLQRRFGDAGHGFHALGKYSRWYGHRGVRYQEKRQWDTCLIIFKCEKDRRYGYGGVSSVSLGNSLSMWGTIPKDQGPKDQGPDELGHNLSRFELWYQKRPDGGGFEIRVDGRVARVVDARAPQVSDGFETVKFADGEHEIEVAALGTGVARGYGVVLERDTPGAVWDELALIGSFIQRLDYEDPDHIAGQVKRRDVDLLAFMFGGNDLSREHSDLKTTTAPYEAEYTRVLRKFRAGKPSASCLILSMTDHARKVGDEIVSRPGVARLVEAQRKVALAEGCAFFDTYKAMGGPGAVERGRKSKPPLASPDLRHPTVAGQRRIATLFYAALMHGYAGFRRAHAGKPLPVLDTYAPGG